MWSRSRSPASGGIGTIGTPASSAAVTATTVSTVGDTRHAADELATTAAQLQGLVARFRY